MVKNEEFYTPSEDGVQVYFSSEDVKIELARIKKAGREILQSKKIITPEKIITPDIGYMALFTDSERNRIALHSLK